MIAIDTTKEFPHLSHAPIVEAVIEIRLSPKKGIEEKELFDYIKEKLTEYQNIEPQRGFTHSFTIGPNQQPHQETQDLGFKGFRISTLDKLQVAIFGKDNYAFSRLLPYENWQNFSTEALRLWNIYKKISEVISMNRLGVRFINKIALPKGEIQLSDYLESPPASARGLDLPLIGFLHQDTMAVPDHGYVINFLQTIQPEAEDILNLILDIDVFTEKLGNISNDKLTEHLDKMKFLKNTVFFKSITNKTLEMLK